MLKPSEQRLYELQMSTKMQKERVDMENHRFWVRLPCIMLVAPRAVRCYCTGLLRGETSRLCVDYLS